MLSSNILDDGRLTWESHRASTAKEEEKYIRCAKRQNHVNATRNAVFFLEYVESKPSTLSLLTRVSLDSTLCRPLTSAANPQISRRPNDVAPAVLYADVVAAAAGTLS